MIDKIMSSATALKDETVRLRRDFHKYPESGFSEFRTASIIIKYLRELGYDVKFGKDVVNDASLLGVPSDAVLSAAKERAVIEGADPELCELLDRGHTAVVATIQGKKKGDSKVVAFRFDIDCNELTESTNENHIPLKLGFRSTHDGFILKGQLFANIILIAPIACLRKAKGS